MRIIRGKKGAALMALVLVGAPFAAAEAQAWMSSGVAPISRTACPAMHPVKGNIAGSGERIYHTPASRYYSRTHPERCYAGAAEAEAAGFRAPKR